MLLFNIYRYLLGKTSDKEESFAKKIKAWFNKIKDKDFDSVVVVPATRSPKLASMRQEMIALLKEILAPENAKKLRGDYRKLAEKTLVK